MFLRFVFPICNIRMEQTWKQNTAIYNYVLFQKKIGRTTRKSDYNIYHSIGFKVTD